MASSPFCAISQITPSFSSILFVTVWLMRLSSTISICFSANRLKSKMGEVSNCSDSENQYSSNYSMVANGNGVKIISDFNSFKNPSVKVNGAVILYPMYSE